MTHRPHSVEKIEDRIKMREEELTQCEKEYVVAKKNAERKDSDNLREGEDDDEESDEDQLNDVDLDNVSVHSYDALADLADNRIPPVEQIGDGDCALSI